MECGVPPHSLSTMVHGKAFRIMTWLPRNDRAFPYPPHLDAPGQLCRRSPWKPNRVPVPSPAIPNSYRDKCLFVVYTLCFGDCWFGFGEWCL